eukprot:1361417-Amorphochlora_amoeboformis.AAC.1
MKACASWLEGSDNRKGRYMKVKVRVWVWIRVGLDFERGLALKLGLRWSGKNALPEFSVWVILIWISVVLLGGSSIALLLGGSNGIVYVAVPLLLPFALLTQLLTARFDGYMFMHPEETSSDVQYWKNVFA